MVEDSPGITEELAAKTVKNPRLEDLQSAD